VNPHTTSHGSYIVRDDDLDVREAAGLGFVERGQSKKSLREKRKKVFHTEVEGLQFDLGLGCLDRKKSSLIQRRGKLRHSYVGQGQDVLF
jgi:hypothetical protein